MPNEDVIVAVSSASGRVGEVARSIIRLSGAGLWQALSETIEGMPAPVKANTVVPCRVRVSETIELDAVLYCFLSPRSYTGEAMAELHVWAATDSVERIVERLCTRARPAGPGEFTLRAYLNGKMDLMQAEAVAQIVSSANRVQLAAAEKLLRGRFSENIARVRGEILEIMSLVEAGLDFSEEDISFISPEQAAARIAEQKTALHKLLEGSVRLERMIDLDAVGLAGLPNAGKSSLLNALLETKRSIVSPIEATTRDVLTGVLELSGTSCVLFDCAGLLPDAERRNAVDRLAHQAAADALGRAELVLFCIDAGKSSFEADVAILSQVKATAIIPVAAKADTAEAAGLERLIRLARDYFSAPVSVTSAKTGRGLAELKGRIENALISGRAGEQRADRLTLNRRHTERLREAVKALGEAADETTAGRDENAAMLLRQTYQTLGGLERENIGEKILDSIFSRFCIGK